jgi:hypothetical protein
MTGRAKASLLIMSMTVAALPPPARAELPQEGLETGIEADLNGDGFDDRIWVTRTDDSRTLYVEVSDASDQFSLDFRPAGQLDLDPFPLGSAALTVNGNVLTVAEQSGGTSSIAATWRFRYTPAMRAMRLIGIDATYYSRSYAHGMTEISWNLLTGDMVTSQADLAPGDGDLAYAPKTSVRSKRRSRPLTMEQSPDPAMLLGIGG